MAHIIGRENLVNAEETIAHRFTQWRLLRQALNLSNGFSQEHKNLAQLGDSIIDTILINEGYRRNMDRGK